MNIDCCLIVNFSLNSKRLLNRFQRHSSETSFDFKTFPPEHISNDRQISQSLLTVSPQRIQFDDNQEDSLSTDDDDEEILSIKSDPSPTDNEYLDELLEWEPNKLPQLEFDEEEEEIILQMNEIDLPTESNVTEENDLSITFENYPMKSEPCHLPQLDGQTDHPSKLEKEKKRKSNSIDYKIFSKSEMLRIKRRKSQVFPQRKKITDYFKTTHRSTTTTKCFTSKQRPANYFDNCIVIDDDDDDDKEEEIDPSFSKSFSLYDTIHRRERLLDNTVSTSSMRIQWLVNVQSILLEHLSKSSETNQSYPIDSSFISTIIQNFLRIILIRMPNEFSFYQFGFTSYLRNFLIELPTYSHNKINEDNHCLDCQQYSYLINSLFDFLFDILDEQISSDNYRCSLLNNEYFNQIRINKTSMKLIIYLIELIEIHREKCSNEKERFSFKNEKKLFQSIENFLRQKNEKISIYLNVMELTLIFAQEKEVYLRQMLTYLSSFDDEYLQLILFDRNLFSDIRLLIINELISKKYSMKLNSIENIQTFFDLIKISMTLFNSVDDVTLLLLRSLFSVYADYLLENQNVVASTLSEQLKTLFFEEFECIYSILIDLSKNSNISEQMTRTVILFRLLKSKWNKLVR